MARQGSVSFGASRRPLYDAAVGALFVLICAASVYLPILLLPGAIILCALLRGGRTTYPALLFALGFAAIVLVCGSFLFAILALVFLLFAVLPIALFQKKLAGRAHFDGVLVQCAGVALGIAAVYGVLYLLLGAEPIHTICAAFESALMQDESESATELLRLSWELKQSMYLMNGETSPTAGALMQVLNSAILSITLVLPVSSLMYRRRLPVGEQFRQYDIPFCVLMALILLLPPLVKKRLYRWQGRVCLILYVMYLAAVLIMPRAGA